MIKRIYLVHHTHMDIGYTDQPREVLDQQLSFLDKAVMLCRKYPAFRWTIESALLLKEYLSHRPERACSEILGYLRSGQMELMGFEVQPLTELYDAKGLYDSVRYAVEIGKTQHFPVECAMLDDIGGYAEAMPSALAASGIRYFVAGVGAFQVFVPWAKLPHLFYLKDKAGAQVLVWNLGVDRCKKPQEMAQLLAVYGLGAVSVVLPWLKYFQLGTDRGVEAENHKQEILVDPVQKFKDLESRLEAEGYPYEEVMLQYGGDNRWPSDFLPELIQKINVEGKIPPVELTTPSVFFHKMEEKYGSVIPTCAGVITDPWISRTNPAPEALKIFSHARRMICRAEALVQRTGNHAADSLLEFGREQLQMYVDHTCGLSEWHVPEKKGDADPDDPVFEPLRQSWKRKRLYAEQAEFAGERALRQLMQVEVSQFPGSSVVVQNHANTPVAGPAFFKIARDLPGILNLRTADGKEIPFQKIDHNLFLADFPEIPAHGIVAFPAEQEPQKDYFVKEPEKLSPLPTQIKTDDFLVELSPENGGIIRLTGKNGLRYDRSDASLFEPILQLPQNYNLAWAGAGMLPITESRFPKAEYKTCGLRWSGPVADAIERRGTLEGDIAFRQIFTFYHHSPRIDVQFFLKKPAHRHLESLALAVPLAGKTKRWQISQNVRSIDPDRDLLPGAMRDLFFVSREAKVETDQFSAVMFSPDAPVLHPGSVQLFQWKAERDFTKEPPAFFWQIYHNMLITDCPAWQPILDEFRFTLYLDAKNNILPEPDALEAFWHYAEV